MAEGERHLRDLRLDRGDPPIVLVPGIDGTALLFYRQQPLLSERFDTVAFPLPTGSNGSGSTSAMTSRMTSTMTRTRTSMMTRMMTRMMTMDTLVASLAQLVEEISNDGAVLLGESFGGALSMSLALRRPDLVRGLVIVNSFPYFDERLKLRIAPWLLRSIPWGAMPIVRRYTSDHLHSPHTDAADIAEFRERAKSIDRDSYIRRLQLLADYDIRDRLAEIEAPTLFLAGDRDRLLPSVRWARYMQERVGSSTMTVLEGYGHVCLIDHDLDLTDHVFPWFDRWRETICK